MLPSCFYFHVVVNLPACRASTPAAGHASGSIWATDVPGWITALATFGLLVGAVITAIYAAKAFGKQSQEVRAIEQQVRDQEALTAQQTELLEIQSGQLDLQRQQFDEQRQVNALQAEVLALQADELRRSLAQREQEAERQHRIQASRVFITQERAPTAPHGHPEPEGVEPFVTATVKNASDLPIYNVELR